MSSSARKKQPAIRSKATVPSQERIIEAAMDMIAEKGLGKARLSLLAQKLEVSLNDLYAIYPDILSIWCALMNQIDGDMVKNAANSAQNLEKKDLYFDMLMARFDAMQTYRAGIVRFLRDVSHHPDIWFPVLTRWNKSLSLMLDMAQDSPLFPVKKAGLAAVYSHALRAWIQDETEMLDKTMVAVDQGLGKADRFVRTFLQKKRP